MFDLVKTICQITGSSTCQLGEVLQRLWSGYGVIQRVQLDSTEHSTAIVKHIDLSKDRENPRGWSGDISYQRKVRSYQIEKTFYENYSVQCLADQTLTNCRVPKFLGAAELENGHGYLIVLEDLHAAGFRDDRSESTDQHDPKNTLQACLSWLASFHAIFLNCPATDLWPIGTYWQLATRQEELQVMPDGQLKRLAAKIDQRLNAAKFQTLVHGDAKLANFLFGQSEVAAVDFQYVGHGCGMKDVAYLLSSCLDGSESASHSESLLDFYFQRLESELSKSSAHISFAELETEWRALYPFAWADFCRFLAGWSPGHWKLNDYNDRLTSEVLRELEQS